MKKNKFLLFVILILILTTFAGVSAACNLLSGGSIFNEGGYEIPELPDADWIEV